MSIALFRAAGGGRLLEQAAGKTGRRPLARAAGRPAGLGASAGARKAGGGGGNLRAAAAEECPGGYAAPGGERRPAAKARAICIVPACDAGHLPVLAGRRRPGPAASKAPDIVRGARDGPALPCGTAPAGIGGPARARKARMPSCPWKGLRMPALGGAGLGGRGMGADPEFQGPGRHGLKNGVRARLPAPGTAPGASREAPMRLCAGRGLRGQAPLARPRIAPPCA